MLMGEKNTSQKGKGKKLRLTIPKENVPDYFLEELKNSKIQAIKEKLGTGITCLY
jgi:hypothetical protein